MPLIKKHHVIYSCILAFVSICFIIGYDILFTPASDAEHEASIFITPTNAHIPLGENFTVQVAVSAHTEVNAFSGIVYFDDKNLSVASIDYNTSIADLWAEVPWYSHGDGTIHFAGGTTRAGGFVGDGDLMTITFHSEATGTTALSLQDAHILKHDGFGTDTQLESLPDALFTISSSSEISPVQISNTNVVIAQPYGNTDLNADGTVSMSDISIFMFHLTTNNTLSDFNHDGSVNTADLSIILDTLGS